MRQDKTLFEKDGKIFLQLDCENPKDLSARTRLERVAAMLCRFCADDF